MFVYPYDAGKKGKYSLFPEQQLTFIPPFSVPKSTLIWPTHKCETPKVNRFEFLGASQCSSGACPYCGSITPQRNHNSVINMRGFEGINLNGRENIRPFTVQQPPQGFGINFFRFGSNGQQQTWWQRSASNGFSDFWNAYSQKRDPSDGTPKVPIQITNYYIFSGNNYVVNILNGGGHARTNYRGSETTIGGSVLAGGDVSGMDKIEFCAPK